MSMFLITIKLPKNPDHDPHNKVTGPCPIVFNKECTDVLGQHHSFLFRTLADLSIEDVHMFWTERYHVTRIEQL